MEGSAQIHTEVIADDYLARLAQRAGPLVVVFLTWWGLNPVFRLLCDRLAGAGFAALGVDYDHG